MVSKAAPKKIAGMLSITLLAVLMIIIPAKAVGQTETGYRTPEVQFLEEKYSLAFNDVITNGEFVTALVKVLNLEYAEPFRQTDESLPRLTYLKAQKALADAGIVIENKLAADDDSRLTSIQAVALAVQASGLKEVADTYNQHKINAALGKLKLPGSEAQTSQFKEVAVAIDSGIVPPAYYKELQHNKAVSPEFAAVLLTKVLNFRGEYLPVNCLGYIENEDIYGKVYVSWKTAELIKAEKLLAIANTAVEQGLVTGYNLRDKDKAHQFDELRTIRYGHSDIKHALQLMALLKSEGLQAKVQFEPKTSAYIYLQEWGEPKITPDFAVGELPNGSYVAYAKEYDISFEFATLEQKQRFQTVIFTYAKKDRENQQGLLYDAWWQPLFTSLTPISGYQMIVDHIIAEGHYEIHTLSLAEKSPIIQAELKAIKPDIQIMKRTVWVDTPFYQYLLGEYK
ncbi:MAG: hypothetical protein H6Q72_304 [Firmicutes bacterium]|nr:hypothetical protein [Bacillota bacterium]